MDMNFTKLMIDTANGVNADNYSLAVPILLSATDSSDILKLPENYSQKRCAEQSAQHR